MKRVLIVISTVLFSWGTPGLSIMAQSPEAAAVFSPDTGYPLRWISGITEDHNGLLWVATRYGLYRYDGHELMQVEAVNGDVENIAGIDLSSMYFVPHLQKLWMTERQSQSIFALDPESFEVEKIAIPPLPQGKLKKISLHMDDHGIPLLALWEDNLFHLYKYQAPTAFEKIVTTPYSKLLFIKSDVANGQYYLGNEWWRRWDAGRRQWSDFHPDVQTENNYLSVHKGQLYHSLSDQLKIVRTDLSGQQPVVLHDFSNDGEVSRLLKIKWIDRLDNIWFGHLKSGTDDVIKLGRINKHGEYLDFSPVLEQNGLKLVGEWQVFEDSNNNMWVTTTQGMIRFPNQQSFFEQPVARRRDAAGHTLSTRSIVKDKYGNTYVTAALPMVNGYLGYDIYKNGRSLLASYPRQHSNSSDLEFFPIWNSLLVSDTLHHTLWFKGLTSLVALRLKDLQFENFDLPAGVPSPNIFSGFCLTSDNNLLMGVDFENLFVFDTEKFRFQKIQLPVTPDKSNTHIHKIINEAANIYWILAGNELYRADLDKGEMDYYSAELLGFRVKQEFVLEGDSILWANTLRSGLGKFNLETMQSTIYTTQDGLSDDVVASIIPHGDKLYIGTFNGLSVFDKRTGYFQTYSTTHGLVHNEFNYHAKYKSPEGKIYLGTLDGPIAFHPDSLQQSTTVPSMQWVRYETNDKKLDSTIVQISGFNEFTEIVVPPIRTYFELAWTLPDFTKPDDNHYFTWLEGFENDWQYRGSENKIRYNTLPAGEYALHVKGSNPSGAPSEQNLHLKIKVGQYFYQNNWFFLALLAAFGGLIYLALRFRFNQKLKLERMRSRIASDLHDEVGSSLTHLSMLMNAVEPEIQAQSSKNYLHRGNEVLREAISKIRDVVWAIDSRNDETGNLIDRMEDFAFDMLKAKNIEYRLEVENFNRKLILPPLLRQNIYLIYKEAINNIVKHSNADFAEIRLEKNGPVITLTVRDNGRCLNNKKVKGQGLSNMKLRAKRVGGAVDIYNKGQGFAVEFTTDISSNP